MSKTARRQRMTGPRGGRYLATLPLAAALALAMAGPAQSGTPSDLHFVTSIGVGSFPGTIAVNPNTNRAYVAPLQ